MFAYLKQVGKTLTPVRMPSFQKETSTIKSLNVKDDKKIIIPKSSL